jgi:hypothetical protein
MRLRPLLLGLLLVLSLLAFGRSGHSGSHGSTHANKPHSKKSTSSSGKTERVKGHYRKNGTYVQSYDRHPAGTSLHESSSIVRVPTTHALVGYRKNYMAEGFTVHPTVQRDRHGKKRRSEAAKDAFKREHPCPSTGRSSGSCRGYVIDHVQALECGGADAPSNMEWQTTADAKAKDRTERYCR